MKALEAVHQPTVLEPESEEFRAAVFSDVLADAVTQPNRRHRELASQDRLRKRWRRNFDAREYLASATLDDDIPLRVTG